MSFQLHRNYRVHYYYKLLTTPWLIIYRFMLLQRKLNALNMSTLPVTCSSSTHSGENSNPSISWQSPSSTQWYYRDNWQSERDLLFPVTKQSVTEYIQSCDDCNVERWPSSTQRLTLCRIVHPVGHFKYGKWTYTDLYRPPLKDEIMHSQHWICSANTCLTVPLMSKDALSVATACSIVYNDLLFVTR